MNVCRYSALLGGAALAGITPATLVSGAAPVVVQRFDFGFAEAAAGWTAVTPNTAYNSERGFGFEAGASIQVVGGSPKRGPESDACTSDRPFFFSTDLPPGNYRVTLTTGRADVASTTIVKAESRRLMLPALTTAAGQTTTDRFAVNTRTPQLPDGTHVKLKPREIGALHWDQRLTLEFNGQHPSPAALVIERIDDAPTLFLTGDSTVTDQQLEPWAAWGQMLPQFFAPTVVIANHAESGETIKSFVGERRWAKVLSLLRAGDYVFIQFGHNDQKINAEHTDAATGFKDYLRSSIADTRAKGARPVLVTSMERRNFTTDGHIAPSLEDYPAAMREVGAELGVPVIDLTAMSIRFYEALGAEEAKHAFVHFPANSFPDQPKALSDDTHFNAWGADALARCVVEGIKSLLPELAAHLRADVKPYDPARPGRYADWWVPRSPPKPLIKPEGS